MGIETTGQVDGSIDTCLAGLGVIDLNEKILIGHHSTSRLLSWLTIATYADCRMLTLTRINSAEFHWLQDAGRGPGPAGRWRSR